MTRWTRVAWHGSCGYCGAILKDGDPVLELRLPNVKKVRLRCQACAGPAPPDLPRQPLKGRSTTRMTDISKLAAASRFNRA